ncbi:MAG: hypothetical protein JSW44_02320, partial [Candidatus Bathyarchaeota archaeon]
GRLFHLYTHENPVEKQLGENQVNVELICISTHQAKYRAFKSKKSATLQGLAYMYKRFFNPNPSSL